MKINRIKKQIYKRKIKGSEILLLKESNLIGTVHLHEPMQATDMREFFQNQSLQYQSNLFPLEP